MFYFRYISFLQSFLNLRQFVFYFAVGGGGGGGNWPLYYIKTRKQGNHTSKFSSEYQVF